MKWYHYLICFFAGCFLANFVPHFVQGIAGASFPTPFADPPGRGLSSSYVNILWAFFNLTIGLILWKAGKVSYGSRLKLVMVFSGFFVMSLMLSHGFKHLYE